MTGIPVKQVYRFGPFEFDSASAELRKSGIRVRVRGKPLQALALLLDRAGEPVMRDELRNQLWGADTFVDFEDSLNHVILRLRQALDDEAEDPRFIATVPGVGYRFDAEVEAKSLTKASPPLNWARLLVGPALAALAVGAIGWAVWPSIGTEPQTPERTQIELVQLFSRGALRLSPTGVRFAPVMPSVAVLPFKSLSGHPEHEVLAEGLTDVLINELAKIGSLRVISRTSTLRYRDPSQSLPEIAEELGVTHVVDGSALQDGNQVRITAQLVEAETDQHVWAESYEESPAAMIALQSRVAREIAQAIQLELTPEEEARLAASRPVDPQVYATYLRARTAIEDGDTDEAIRLFEETLELDPDYAPAYAWLADTYINTGWWVGVPAEVLSRAKTAALRAQRLDRALADPHLILGQVRSYYEWEWEEAEQHYQRALELNPSHVRAYLSYAQYLLVVNRPADAVETAEKALRIDPLSPYTVGTAGHIYHGARQFPRAIELLKRATAMGPQGPFWNVDLACVYTMAGMYDEAIEQIKPLAAVAAPEMRPKAVMAWSYAMAGDREKSVVLMDELEREWSPQHATHYHRAFVYSAVGDLDRAFAMLDQAIEEKWPYLGSVAVLPPYDSIRDDPRYARFLDRIGLGEIRERNAGG